MIGTNGIGPRSRLFAANGAEAVVVGRTFRDQGLERLRFIQADLSEMKQTERVVQELSAESWDMLLFTSRSGPDNGGREGIEIDVAISYLSRFVILREVAEQWNAKGIGKTQSQRMFIWAGPGVGIAGIRTI